MSDLQRTSRAIRPAGPLLLTIALTGLSCNTPSQATEEAEVLQRARVELGRGLWQVKVDVALLDASRSPYRAQVELSTESNISRKVRGYFEWQDEAGITLGGRAEQTKSIRSGRRASFTSFAPSPEAYQFTFIAQGG